MILRAESFFFWMFLYLDCVYGACEEAGLAFRTFVLVDEKAPSGFLD